MNCTNCGCLPEEHGSDGTLPCPHTDGSGFSLFRHYARPLAECDLSILTKSLDELKLMVDDVEEPADDLESIGKGE